MFMFLKRLETVGFKSFAERIDVDFVPGVTAVVGPNGSGKSNITDAIRWVLGEQSARSLRGSKMEDIIFQGSDTRNALNVAEVTLVLDNREQTLPLDYKEVSVTRRVYRSGESEFYINKQACRLKDIVDLFMDSGLGREAFSIISQGKVEEILSSKAEERRVIFEEAAGVLKYKQRKRKSELKLEETQENLNRVDDIIHEIEQQINPLEHQSRKAETYLQYSEELKEKEISFLITEIEELNQKWNTTLEQLENDKMKEIEWKTSIQQKEANLEKERHNINHLDEIIEKQQAELLNVTQQLEKYQGKKQVRNERFKHVEANKEKLQQQKKEAKERVTKIKSDLGFELEALKSLKKDRQETRDKAENLEVKLSTSEENILEQIEELKSIYIEYLNKQAAKRNEKQSISQQLTQLTAKKEKHAHSQQDLIKDKKQLSNEHQVAEKDSARLEEKYTKERTNLINLKKDLEKERSLFQESQTKLYQGYQHIEKMKSRKEMLEELKEDFQGFFYGVKAVLKARQSQKISNIHGAVLELIDIPKQFITAIETVLGGQAQHVVVTDEQSARDAINFLKKTQKGRATFLPLDIIKPRYIPDGIQKRIKSHNGFIGIASQLVKTMPRYENVINYLMGHVVIASTLKDANEMARLSDRRYRIVTLEGDVVNPGGSMSGGAKQQKNSSIFTREKDLKEVTEKLKDFELKATTFANNVKNQQTKIEGKESEIDKLEKDIQQVQKELQNLREYNTEINLRLESQEESIELHQREQRQFNQDEKHLKEKLTGLETGLKEIEKNLESIQGKIDFLSEQEMTFKENREKLQDTLHDFQVALAEQDERVKHQQQKTVELKQQLVEAEKKHQDYSHELEKLIEMIQSEESEKVVEEKIKTNMTAKDQVLKEIQQHRAERSERTQRMSDAERELKEENRLHQDFIGKVQEKEVKANRLDVDLENRLTQLQNDYEITYERAKQNYEKSTNIEETKDIVDKLKKKINNLGTVNLGAIDEYKRLSERYTFLTEQKDDLVTAKQTLFSAILEMDTEMKRLFDDTFSQIKEEFSIVFKELFGGGYAELKLTDPKDLLNTGVDIIAQPPGKKLQHLGLLSGGERALTAIALLFAILRVRPVPFCVLDEVEAALDEANVYRFAKYVQSHSENTQFIVITHRKGTMEEADVLYGVTMQESGVSRLVSVKLEETEELIRA